MIKFNPWEIEQEIKKELDQGNIVYCYSEPKSSITSRRYFRKIEQTQSKIKLTHILAEKTRTSKSEETFDLPFKLAAFWTPAKSSWNFYQLTKVEWLSLLI